jgi:hypothetical protein
MKQESTIVPYGEKAELAVEIVDFSELSVLEDLVAPTCGILICGCGNEKVWCGIIACGCA